MRAPKSAQQRIDELPQTEHQYRACAIARVQATLRAVGEFMEMPGTGFEYSDESIKEFVELLSRAQGVLLRGQVFYRPEARRAHVTQLRAAERRREDVGFQSFLQRFS